MTDLTINLHGHDVPTIIHDYSPGEPARTNCLPEDSYPAEPAEVDFTINTGNDHLNELLQEHHFDEIEDQVLVTVEQAKKDAAEEQAEQAYESRKDAEYDQ